MRSPTFILFRALLGIGKLTELWGVVIIVSPLIFYRMVVIAALVVVRRIFLRALDSFEIAQVQVLDLHDLSSPVMHLVNEHEDFFVWELVDDLRRAFVIVILCNFAFSYHFIKWEIIKSLRLVKTLLYIRLFSWFLNFGFLILRRTLMLIVLIFGILFLIGLSTGTLFMTEFVDFLNIKFFIFIVLNSLRDMKICR